ncbi:MAG: DNA-directed RNA polymerase subunit omega [Oscillospiraceae bacterium]|nr:DNA-directed RNA polymerase subunit omega [Oscillospiraceae bacterium]
MLRPAVSEILKEGQSYYSLVIAVAKRAREIAQNAEDEHIIMTEKPVKIAVQELAAGKFKIIEPENVGVNPET